MWRLRPSNRQSQETLFRIELVALVAAGINAAVYHVVTERRVAASTAGPLPVAACAAGLTSVTVWSVAILAGRMMSYTMFQLFWSPPCQ